MPAAYHDINDLLMTLREGNEAAVDAVRARDATLTKPAGSLGQMEELVRFLARWQGRSEPTLENPMVAVFAGNHGVTDQGVSAFPRAVTAQMVANFTEGGAAISQICALHGLNLRVFELALDLPTGDITREPAMDDRMCAATIAYGMEAIAGKPDLLCIGEMGIGNTTVAAALYARLFGGTAAQWIGRGTGVDDAGLARKESAVERALERPRARIGPSARCAREPRRARNRGDAGAPLSRPGTSPSRWLSMASLQRPPPPSRTRSTPASIEHCLFAHVSAEHAHRRAPCRDRPHGTSRSRDEARGGGPGAALAAVLMKTALHLHQNMATFEDAGVAGRSPD